MQKTNLTLFMSVIAIIFTVSCTQQPEGFTIHGEVEGFEDSTKIYLQDFDKQAKIDSSLILNGKFEFKGKVEEPEHYVIITAFTQGQSQRPEMKWIWVDNSEITIKGNKEGFAFAKIQGSEPQRKADLFNSSVEHLEREKDSLYDKYITLVQSEDSDNKEIKTIRSQLGELSHKIEEKRMEFIKKNINSYEALLQLGFKKTRMDEDTLRMLYNQINEEFEQTSYAKVMHTFLNTEAAEVGEPFKDFTAETMDGNAFKLSDIKDEYILLEFGSAGCGPCRIFNKTLAKQYDSFKEKMKVVSFSLDVNKEDIIKEAEKDGVSWTLVSDFQGINGKTPIQYRINAIPTFYIISPEGIIVECVFGFSPEFLDKFKKIVEDHKKEKEA